MQNKPNFQHVQMNIYPYNTTAYEKFIPLAGQKNKPNSNPNKPNCRKGEIDAKSVFTKGYIKKDDFAVRINKPNSNPISVKPKMSANTFFTKDYENNPPSGSKKTNPIQTQSKPVLN